MLRGSATRAGDELILADNSGTVPADAAPAYASLRADRRALARRTPATSAPAAATRRLDPVPRRRHDRAGGPARPYFDAPMPDDVGALAGEIRPRRRRRHARRQRYGAQRNFLSARAHLAHPFRPRAAAANLLVRRAAFEAAGGFREGLRAAEDTDFCWRLQELGWRLELREEAAVEHVYRETVRELRRSGAGTRPAARGSRGATRAFTRSRQWSAPLAAWAGDSRDGARPGARAAGAACRRAPARTPPCRSRLRRLERCEFLALDVVLAVEELIGLRMDDRIASADDCVDLVDPSAFTPPYDHALASRWRARGARVRLITSGSPTARSRPPTATRSSALLPARAGGARIASPPARQARRARPGHAALPSACAGRRRRPSSSG